MASTPVLHTVRFHARMVAFSSARPGFLPGSDLRGSDLLRLSRRRARRRPAFRAGNRVGDGCSRLGPHLLDTFAHAEEPAPRPELVKRRGQQDAIALRGLESDLALESGRA